jgi:hypothetical protein
VFLPPDWTDETPVTVVDLTDLPPGLTPNLNGDGTYYGHWKDIPKDWEWRDEDDLSWHSHSHYGGPSMMVVQARPAPQPPTEPTAEKVIARYLAQAPEQGDWEWEDHCEGVASGVLGALKAAGYGLIQLVDGDNNQETGEPFYPLCTDPDCGAASYGSHTHPVPGGRDMADRPGGGDQ